MIAEEWSPAGLRTTGQEAYGRAVAAPPLEAGERGVVYFPVLRTRTDGVTGAWPAGH